MRLVYVYYHPGQIENFREWFRFCQTRGWEPKLLTPKSAGQVKRGYLTILNIRGTWDNPVKKSKQELSEYVTAFHT
jgi:hypothetical protein